MRQIVIAVLFILGVGLFLYNYPFPKEINIVKPAVAFVENDNNTPTVTTITVDGTLIRPIFKQHYFDGKITIEGHDFTYTSENIDIGVVKKENGVNYSALNYYGETIPFNLRATASIYFDENFDNISIVTRDEWIEKEPKSLYYIVTGKTYDDAYRTQILLSNKFGSDSLVAPQFIEKSKADK